ncbi:MAG: hypothetical protein ACI4MA_11605 [Treponema sp.]
MTEPLHLTDCPKFTLLLKSHTQKKRLTEAKKELLTIYPFEVEEQKLLIIRTDKKDKYDVYISNEEITHESEIKKILLISLLCVTALCALIMIMHNVTAKKMEEARRQKELEKQKQEQDRLEKRKEEELDKLKAEYLDMKESEYEKIYPYIERIYSAMPEKTTIENISIDRNHFTVEVTTNDSVTILSNFEGSNAFSEVKMTRTNIKGGKESVSYMGDFSRLIKTADENLSLDEKIYFYTEEIKRINKRTELLKDIQISEYLKNIRAALHKNSCQEQYIQFRSKEKNAEIEFFVLSSSRAILIFLNEIQSKENSLVDVKSIRIHNSEERNGMQTTICFDTGIELKQADGILSEYADLRIDADEIDRIFYKTTAPKPAMPKSHSAINVQPQNVIKMQTPVKLKKLTYIGLTKSNAQTFILAKDEDMGSIYKLCLMDRETDGDFCIKDDGGFMARLRGEYYEVKK